MQDIPTCQKTIHWRGDWPGRTEFCLELHTRGRANEFLQKGRISDLGGCAQRKLKAQLDLNPAIAVKDNKNIYINTWITKRGLRRISILYWMWGEILTKDKKKAEVFNDFFVSVFLNSQQFFLRVPKPLSWKMDGEQNKTPKIQGKLSEAYCTT